MAPRSADGRESVFRGDLHVAWTLAYIGGRPGIASKEGTRLSPIPTYEGLAQRASCAPVTVDDPRP
jgi:hypothetical protein